MVKHSACGLTKRNFLQAVKDGAEVEVYHFADNYGKRDWSKSLDKSGWKPVIFTKRVNRKAMMTNIIEHFGIKNYRIKETVHELILQSKVSTPAGYVVPNIKNFLSDDKACKGSKDILTKRLTFAGIDRYYYKGKEIEIINTGWNWRNGKYKISYKFIKEK